MGHRLLRGRVAVSVVRTATGGRGAAARRRTTLRHRRHQHQHQQLQQQPRVDAVLCGSGSEWIASSAVAHLLLLLVIIVVVVVVLLVAARSVAAGSLSQDRPPHANDRIFGRSLISISRLAICLFIYLFIQIVNGCSR